MSYEWDTTGDFNFEINDVLQASITAGGFTLKTGTTITNFNTATDLGGVGAVNAAVPTQLAVKTYVDNAVSGIAYWDRTGTVLHPDTAGDTVAAGAGTVGAPGYAFEEDVDTGFYNVSSNTIGVAVGGSQKASFSETQVYLQGGDTSAVTVDGTAGITLETVTSGHISVTSVDRLTLSGGDYVDIDATAGPVYIDATGAISLGAGAASDFTVAADLTLQTTGSGNIALTSARGVDITANAGDVDTNITGSFLVDATNAISLDAGGASNFAVQNGNLSLETVVSGDILLTSISDIFVDCSSGEFDLTANVIDLNSVTGVTVDAVNDIILTSSTADIRLDADYEVDLTALHVDINATSTVTVDSGASISIDAVTSSNFTVTGTAAVALTLAATSSSGDANVLVSASSQIDLTAATVDINASGAVTIDAGGASNFAVQNGNLSLETVVSGDILLTSISDIFVDCVSGEFDLTANVIDLNSVTALTMDSATFSIDATGTSNLTVTGTGTVALNVGATSATTLADVNISADREIDLTSSIVDINTTGATTIDSASISLDAAGTSNFTVAGANLTVQTTTSGDITVSASDNLALAADTTNIGILLGDLPAGMEGIAASAILSTSANVGLGGTVTNSGTGGSIVDWTATATGGGASSASLRATASGGSSATVNVESDGVVNLVYDKDAAGSSFYIKNNATAVATFSSGISLDALTDANITLTVTDSLVTEPHILLRAAGAGAAIDLDGDFDVTTIYNNLNGAGRYQVYEDDHLILDIDSTGVVAWTPGASANFTVTTTGNGDIQFISGDTGLFSTAGQLSLGTSTLSNVYITQNSESRLWINTSGAMTMTPASGQDFTISTIGVTGDILLSAGADVNLTPTDDLSVTAGGDVFIDSTGGHRYRADTQFQWYQDGTAAANLRAEITTAGGIAFTPLSGQVFSTETIGTGYSLIDGVYYVNGSNSTAFATLLQNLTGDAQIILGAGTHDISWTTVQTFAYELKIVGSGAGNTFIRFTSGDADCCLNFTNHVEIQSVAFTRSTTMTNQVYGVQLGADYSSIRDCIFQINPQGPGSYGYAISVAGDYCTLDNVSFNTLFPSDWLIYVTGTGAHISKVSSVNSTCTGGSVWMTSNAVSTKMSDCYYNCAYGSSYATVLYCQGNDSRFSNVEVYAGESDQTGHNPQCLTVEADNCHFDNCTFNTGWNTSTNCSSRNTYITGQQNQFSNCYWYQRMMDYTLAGNPTDGMVHVNGYYNGFSNCRIIGTNSKCNLFLNSGADYTRVNGCYIGSAVSNNGSYQVSSAIWGVAGAHYGIIVGNFLRHDGDTLGRCVAASATNACYSWVIVGNVCYMASGTVGIYVDQFSRSTILGNSSSSSTLDAATSGTNTTNQYGTSNVNEASGANY